MHRTILFLLCTLLVPLAATAAEGPLQHHTVGLFLGGTDEDGGSTEFTYGVEYGYKFTPKFGVGAIYERTDEGHDGKGVEVLLGSLFYRPIGGWRFGLGAGQEDIDGDTETLYRFSVAHHFHRGKLGITPSVSIDRVDDYTHVVFGVAFSRSF